MIDVAVALTVAALAAIAVKEVYDLIR